MDFMILGAIGFGRLTSPVAYTSRTAASYAELNVIDGKPLLQYTGDGLQQISLDFFFHAEFCDPQYVWDSLSTLLAEHQALRLFQGDGLVVGQFVILDLARDTITAGENGALIAFDCRMELLEYVDSEPLLTSKAEQQGQAAALTQPGRRAPAATIKDVAMTGSAVTGDVDSATIAAKATRQDMDEVAE
jgi:phage protein U